MEWVVRKLKRGRFFSCILMGAVASILALSGISHAQKIESYGWLSKFLTANKTPEISQYKKSPIQIGSQLTSTPVASSSKVVPKRTTYAPQLATQQIIESLFAKEWKQENSPKSNDSGSTEKPTEAAGMKANPETPCSEPIPVCISFKATESSSGEG